MKFSAFAMAALTLAGSLSFSSCKKDSDSSPNYGSVNYGGESTSLVYSESNSSTFGYDLGGASTSDTTAQNFKAVGVSVPSRPTANREYTISDSVVVTYITVASGIPTAHYYVKPGEKIQATVTGGKVKFTFSNLTETNEAGGNLSGGKSLSGSIMEK